MKTPRKLILYLAVLSAALLTLSAQEPAPSPGGETAAPTIVSGPSDAMQLVEVDWMHELKQGGMTIVALGVLSVALLAFTLERLITMRRDRFVPEGLTMKVLPLHASGQDEQILAHCKRQPSTLSRIIEYFVEHRNADVQVLGQVAADIGYREITEQEQRNTAFAVIAALAPLLGLLGTMIGMIESFKLVEVFGDEGGASMLAGAISKALITTAVGLLLAIPAIAIYHIFKYRLHKISGTLEHETEKLVTDWFVKKGAAEAAYYKQYYEKMQAQQAVAEQDTPPLSQSV